jgi:hypothetical protein
MTRNKLAKLKQDLAAVRRTQATAKDVERLAKRLGRRRKKRGKEPTWESEVFANLYPLTIPHHGGKDLASATKKNILAQLEQDVLAWEMHLDDEVEDENESGDSHGNGNTG